jgi:hypothetical protein
MSGYVRGRRRGGYRPRNLWRLRRVVRTPNSFPIWRGCEHSKCSAAYLLLPYSVVPLDSRGLRLPRFIRSRVRPTFYSPCGYARLGHALTLTTDTVPAYPILYGMGDMFSNPLPRCPSLVVAFLLTRRANQQKLPTFPDGYQQDVDDAASEVLV